MANPLLALTAIKIGTDLLSGFTAKKASDKAADRAAEAAEFNAQIIERDIDLLTRQRQIINANFAASQTLNARAFEKDVQGKARSGYAYAGFDLTQGTPIDVLRENAREYDYEIEVAEFNNAITNMQIDDAIEESKLQAELTRMSGQANASGLRASGTASLLKELGSAVSTGMEYSSA
tara:strand:- start:1297 stop:1830 length:534 start_codon:yes stop_codon:yes gene_type:complete